MVQQGAAGGTGFSSREGRRAAARSHRASAPSEVIQRDDAGGGSTEFEDRLTVLSRPASGPGVIEGLVTRIEIAPASGSRPREEIHRGEMNLRFDPSDCSITIPLGYKFVQALSGGGCNEPPQSTTVSPLSSADFTRLKAGVLADINRSLNGWFEVRLSGRGCPGGCTGPRPIRVDAREDPSSTKVITVVNRGGRADSGTICARSWDRSTAVHESGHQVLGVGDEYPELDKSFRAANPGWFRPERVRRDYSAMGPEAHTRFAMFHERHFHAVKTFLEKAFPGCIATLHAKPRPVILDYRFSAGFGYASLNSNTGMFAGLGFGMGIPLDRLRRWELVPGLQFNALQSLSGSNRSALLAGVRLGLERSTGEAGHGFTGGVFGEAGVGWFKASDYGPGGAGERRARTAYGELGVSAGYRTPMLEGSPFRFDLRVEGAMGSALGASGDPTAHAIETDPERSRWFRFGVILGFEF